jgi:hypothetical protein
MIIILFCENIGNLIKFFFSSFQFRIENCKKKPYTKNEVTLFMAELPISNSQIETLKFYFMIAIWK